MKLEEPICIQLAKSQKLVHLPISTIRYYDKEGLFPTLERTSGIRKFSEKELEALRMIECLKKSGLKIKEIKLFMEWCAQGSSTYEKRLELFLHQRKAVEEKLKTGKSTRHDPVQMLVLRAGARRWK